ncbi:hydroxypyruvate isomerase [Vibrio rumoiensis]|uniref:Hydroxypyruvate isomerase n=1 Tax=Vibrio rumoiensis TaxID=76258 RepID=A0ABW7J147_9VIBR|nr:hydroxypyruvate isomerase [Vibrio rumoiensis]
MPKFAANLSMLFTEVDFLQRFGQAAEAGFQGVEYLFPYDFEPSTIQQVLEENQLQQVLFNLPAGNWLDGDRGIAVDPKRVDEFQQGVAKAIQYAKALNCSQVNCLAGIVPDGVTQQQAEDTFVSNLRFAAGALKENGISLIIEAINTRDIPGFFLTNTKQALDIIEKVGSDNLNFQYDIYHMQIMEGDLAPTLSEHLSQIQHVQLADNPGRHEPGTGEINYPFLFNHLDSIGYDGWIGCEYKPKTTTQEGLVWLKEMA